jgi:hypothetical protein
MILYPYLLTEVRGIKMGNYVMQVDFFGNSVRCDTDGLMISLNDLLTAGNNWRAKNDMPLKRLEDITGTNAFKAFKADVCEETGMAEEEVFKSVKGRNGRTMAHVFIAVYVAEQISSKFHVKVIKTFVESKLLEFRDLGGTEFKTVNLAVDMYLPGREGKENKGIYINLAKLLREKILGPGSCTDDWNKASVAQTHARYEAERKLSDMLRLGVIRDWDHLKELIGKL